MESGCRSKLALTEISILWQIRLRGECGCRDGIYTLVVIEVDLHCNSQIHIPDLFKKSTYLLYLENSK